MGALISLPLAPLSMLTSCCISSSCSMLSSISTNPYITRIIYSLIFLVNSILSWIVLSPIISNKIHEISFGYINLGCSDESCSTFTSVHRINFALGLFHLFLAIFLFPNESYTDALQNGYWNIKVFVWLFFVVTSFLVPDFFFKFFGTYLSPLFSIVFIILGLILLIDFVHELVENCLIKIEEDESTHYKYFLISGTLINYIITIVSSILMFVYFGNNGCSLNVSSIIVNLCLATVVSLLSVSPQIQSYNSNSGLAQSSLVSIYCTYLTLSSIASQPDDNMCNPLVRSRGTRTLSIVVGAFFTFAAITYTTIRAADSFKFSKNDEDNEEDLENPNSRIETIIQAINEGVLPESALHEALYKAPSKTYNYSLFHIIFFMATQYIATLLTTNVPVNKEDDFVPVGRTYFNVWLKLVSCWICYMLYAWSLVVPVLFPERFNSIQI